MTVKEIDAEITDIMRAHYLTPLSSRCDATGCSCGVAIPVSEGEKPGLAHAKHLANEIAQHFMEKERPDRG